MQENIALSRALDAEGNRLYSEVEDLVNSLYSEDLKLANTQISSLKAAANGSTDPSSVSLFIKYQAGRDGRAFEGWRAEVTQNQGRSRSLHDLMAEFVDKTAKTRAREVLDGGAFPSFIALTTNREKDARLREVAMELVRRYVTTFAILYRYRVMLEGGNSR